jgi:hypothetical protein
VIWVRRVTSEAGRTTNLGDFHGAVYALHDPRDWRNHRSFCVTDSGPEETSFRYTSLPLSTIVISCLNFVASKSAFVRNHHRDLSGMTLSFFCLLATLSLSFVMTMKIFSLENCHQKTNQKKRIAHHPPRLRSSFLLFDCFSSHYSFALHPLSSAIDRNEKGVYRYHPAKDG